MPEIEESFSAEKAGALSVDLTAAYNNVWQAWPSCMRLSAWVHAASSTSSWHLSHWCGVRSVGV